MILTTIVLFLLVLGVIVFFHELGHFFMAKLYGVKVEEFGIGFPPKIFGFKKGETQYTVNWIPLGGFVKIVGQDGEEKGDPRSFSARSVSQRFQIISAGVIMNFILAFVIFSAIFMVGFPQNITGSDISELKNARDFKVRIDGVVKDTPAFAAGLKVGDAILKIDDVEIRTIEELQSATEKKLDQKIVLDVSRMNENLKVEVVPRKEHPKNEGAIGISLAQTAVISYSPLEAIRRGFEYTVFLTMALVSAFAGIISEIFKTGGTTAEISGPVGIAAMTQQAAVMGIVTVLNFIAIISVNLAIINVLPLPALDGGRLLFLVVEKIKGSPLNQEWEAKVNNLGFMLLMLLMVVVTFKDILKFDLWGKVAGLFG
ncbi:MAG: RIP metalloprotease RseP [Minisyncoccia bacterium]